MTETLRQEFGTRDELAAYVQGLSPWAEGEPCATRGGARAAQAALAAIKPIQYGRTRNFGNGHVTRLSPYIRHGIVSLNAVRNAALALAPKPELIEKFIQELTWRDYWQRIYAAHPEWIWQDVEPYKTGFQAADYATELPKDIASGRTGIAALDHFIAELLTTGYLHNHARMYLAAYVVHFRRVQWQAGARWFLHHLLDGDPASNNLSWQWVASTFSNKPYLFNLENVAKYFTGTVNVDPEANELIDATYEELSSRLFPHLGGRL